MIKPACCPVCGRVLGRDGPAGSPWLCPVHDTKIPPFDGTYPHPAAEKRADFTDRRPAGNPVPGSETG